MTRHSFARPRSIGKSVTGRRPNDEAQRTGHHDRPRNGKRTCGRVRCSAGLGRRAKHDAPPSTAAEPTPPGQTHKHDASPSTPAQDRIGERRSQANSLALRRIGRPNDEAQRTGLRPASPWKRRPRPGPLQRRVRRRSTGGATATPVTIDDAPRQGEPTYRSRLRTASHDRHRSARGLRAKAA